MTDEIILETIGLSKRFGETRALDKVDFEVKRNEILGIVGENGSGKSTLMKCLVGVYKPDVGHIHLNGQTVSPKNLLEAGKMGVYMCFQQSTMIPNLHVYENLFFGLEDRFTKFGTLQIGRMISECRKEINALGIDIDPAALVSDLELSKGYMVEITRALSTCDNCETPIIILDEATAALSKHEIGYLFEKMSKLKDRASFIFISHRLLEVIDISDRICIMKDGKIVTVLDQNKKKITEPELHGFMVGRARDADFYKENKQLPHGDVILSVKGLTRKGAFHDVSFDLHRGEILGIGGVIGSGKSELGKAIGGALRVDGGCLMIDGRKVVPERTAQMMGLGVSYLPRDRKLEGLVEGFSVRWNMTLPSLWNFVIEKLRRLGLLNLAKEGKTVKEYIEKLSIATPGPDAMVFNLSGGNQQKVVLAKWLIRNFKVLVADNVTTGVDVGVKQQIYEILRSVAAEGGSIILITDDLLELIGLSSNIYIMKDGMLLNKIESPPEKKPTEKEVVAYMV